jgi:curved DNA-binding protein CbpA
MNRRESLDTLGLQNGATDDEIKRKFRILAKKSHPDLNKDNANARNDFIKLKKAYDTLLNDKKVDPPIISTVHVDQNSFGSLFDIIIDDFDRFFIPRKYHTSDTPISTPEPYVDLRRIVRERNRKKNIKDYY